MTKVVFETATIADAVKKADRIAPTRGSAFDKAAGLVFQIDPDQGVVVLQATDTMTFSKEWIDIVESSGQPVEWRVPSTLFAQVMAGLPIGSGSTVTLEDKMDRSVRKLFLTCGKIKAKFNLMMTDHYPVWPVFSPDGLVTINDMGGRIAMAEWAADPAAEPPLSGVCLDGELVKATDRYRLAVAPLSIPNLSEPIVIPAGILSAILKQTGEVKVGVHDGLLLIMPDATTQIRSTVFDVKYPPVERIMNRDYPHKITVKRAPLLEMMQRTSAFAGKDRYPILRIFIGKGEIVCMMNTREVGDLMDSMELGSQASHDRFEVKFTPKNILTAIQTAPNETVDLYYDTSDSMKAMYLDGGSGYEAWMMPRKDLTAAEAAEQEKDDNG